MRTRVMSIVVTLVVAVILASSLLFALVRQ